MADFEWLTKNIQVTPNASDTPDIRGVSTLPIKAPSKEVAHRILLESEQTDAVNDLAGWSGPYVAQCWTCEKLATELNRLPALIEHLRYRLTEDLYLYHSLTTEDARRTNLTEPKSPLETSIASLRSDIKKVNKQFSLVSAMFINCEEKYCRVVNPRELNFYRGVGDVFYFEVDQAIGLFGSNNWNARDLSARFSNDYTSGGTPAKPPPTPEPVPGPIPGPDPSPDPTPNPDPDPGPTPNPTPDPIPGMLNVTGDINIIEEHVVNQDTCPQAVGSSMLSNTGETDIEYLISESPAFINVTGASNGILNPGQEISIEYQFNCAGFGSLPAPGSSKQVSGSTDINATAQGASAGVQIINFTVTITSQ